MLEAMFAAREITDRKKLDELLEKLEEYRDLEIDFSKLKDAGFAATEPEEDESEELED